MTMQSNSDDLSSTIGGFLKLVLDILQLIFLAAFILSTWLTRLLFQWVFLPLWPGLERHDGLVVVISGTLWAGVAGLGIFPYLLHADLVQVQPEQLAQSWLASVGIGAVWGALVAVWVLVVWWEEILAQQPAPAFTQVLGLSAEFYQHSEPVEQPALESLEALEAEFFHTMQPDAVYHTPLVR